MSASEDEDRHRKKQALEDELRSMNKRLGRDVSDVAGNSGEKPEKANAKAGFGKAMRLSSEFISAILVGAAIGYGIDWLAGTKPWAMIFFLFLGFIAGVINLLRISGEMTDPYKDVGVFKDENSSEEN